MEVTIPTSRAFEDLVRRILEANNFRIFIHSPRGDAGFDFDATFGSDRWAIEVKYYRTARAQPSLLEAAATRLVNNGIVAQAVKGMLVVSSVLPPDLRSSLEQKYSITLVDQGDLRNWAAVAPLLLDELDVLLETSPREPSGPISSRSSPHESSKNLRELPQLPRDSEGTDLCRQMKAVKRGKVGWSEYEEICKKILKYLFSNDLLGWHAQKRTDDGLNRFDYVCRVRPTTEFWEFVLDHLDSRYILFEFKNYAARIKQGQVLSTEKYLLERGLRRVAIIFSREGADADAVKMTQGAMREHGKLMLIVDDKIVCEMLHKKELGEDPTDCLFDLADNFLLSLPR